MVSDEWQRLSVAAKNGGSVPYLLSPWLLLLLLLLAACIGVPCWASRDGAGAGAGWS